MGLLIRTLPFFVLLFVGLGDAFGIKIFLKGQAIVEDEQIRLKDIAEAQDLGNLGNTILGRAPYPGDVREISKDLVRSKLRHLMRAEDLVLLGPDTVKVERAFRVIDPEELRQMVEEELRRKMDGLQMVTVRSVSQQGQVVVPTGPLNSIVELPSLGGVRGQIPVSILFYQGDSFRRKVVLTAQISAMGEVVVSKGSFGRGRLLKREDLELAIRDLNEIPKDALRTIDEVVGKTLKRSISYGEVFRANMLEFPTVVKKGQTVTILLENERLKITALGTAQESGSVGEVIKVANSDSKKILHARIVDKDIVRVEF
ncbi:MAG: flagellar basal body P-ring formation chaperone FlgA [Desulfatiglandales bacterium]